jgi:hypothetical protein
VKEDKKGDSRIFIDALTDALGRSNEQSIDEVKKDLQNDGIDVEKTMKKLINMVQEISMTAKREQLDIAREKREKMESKKSFLVNKFTGWNKEKVIAKIKEIASSLGTDVSIAYRDLDSKNTEDLKSLLEDMEMTKDQCEQEKDINEK